MSVFDSMKHAVHTVFKETVEAVTPVSNVSQFRDKGVLTPEEFVAAGDLLVFKCPSWTWEAGDPSKTRDYLPKDKQYLVTRNVPCHRRADGLASSVREMQMEKRQLSLNINKLDEDKLGKVVEIIKKRKSNIMGKDSEEIEIDIDSLDNATLRELEKYVDECLRPKPQKVSNSKQAQLQSAARQAVGGMPANAGSPASSSDSDSDSDSDGGDLRGAAWSEQLGD